MCRSWLSNQVPSVCLGRRLYEDVMAPTHLLLVEEWQDQEAVNSYLASERFRALIGAVKVLGKLIDVRVFQATVLETGAET
jgi:quinol monooxygenase YgiN